MPEQDPFQRPLQKLELAIQHIKPQLVDAIGNEGLLFIDRNFEKEAFQGETDEPWEELKKPPKKPRKILQDNEHLRRSFIKEDSSDHTTISTDIVYAQVHNEGLEIRHRSRAVILNYRGARGGKLKLAKVRTESQQRRVKTIRRANISEHITKMPQRQFVGPSPVLDRACEKIIIIKVLPVLNNI